MVPADVTTTEWNSEVCNYLLDLRGFQYAIMDLSSGLISIQNKSINPVTKFLMASVNEILTSLAKAKGYTIICALKDPKTWIELEKIAKGDKIEEIEKCLELLEK